MFVSSQNHAIFSSEDSFQAPRIINPRNHPSCKLGVTVEVFLDLFNSLGGPDPWDWCIRMDVSVVHKHD